MRRYPHVGECTLPLRVLAVQSAMLRNRYGTLQSVTGARYRAVTERYGSVTEPLWNVAGRYRTVTEALQNVTERCSDLWSRLGTLRNVMEALWNVTERYGSVGGEVTEPLWKAVERYGTFRGVAGRYGTLWKCCRSLRNVSGALRSPNGTLRNRYRKYRFCPSLIKF